MRLISIGTDGNILKGEGRVFERIFEYRKLAKKFIVLVFTKDSKLKKIEKENFLAIPIFGRNKLEQVFRLYKIVRFLDEQEQRTEQGKQSKTIVLSQDPFEIGFISYLITRKYSYKLNLQLHTDISSSFFKRESIRNYFQFLLARFLFKKADSIRVVSEKLKRYLYTNLQINKDKIFYLPIHTDTNNFSFSYKNNSNKTNILMISRIEEVKNIPLGIRAVKALRKISGIDYKLRIVGTGNLKEILKRKFDYSWIIWKDWTENVEREYKFSDVLLITSNYEGWGLTAIEAVACGTPVVMSPVGVAEEFIQTGVNGYVARGHDIVNIMEALHLGLTHEYDEIEMKKSLKNLDTKEEYFNKFQQMLNVV